MTTREQILYAITTYWAAYGYAPSVRDLCTVVSVTPSTMHGHLRRLRDKGLIAWEAGRVRTLRRVQDA